MNLERLEILIGKENIDKHMPSTTAMETKTNFTILNFLVILFSPFIYFKYYGSIIKTSLTVKCFFKYWQKS